jgi:glycosyltransferase involved in cell wall biosynthesis
MGPSEPIRVLYSFPHKLGAERICTTAWYQVQGLEEAGAAVTVFAGALAKPPPPRVAVACTLARGRWRIPYRLLGSMRAFALHDRIVARRLERMAARVDLVHAWPLGALQTLRTARRLGIPTVLERPNAHTRFAYEAVRQECERLGVALPRGHEHAYNDAVLQREEEEYTLATRLLCPSEFVADTFRVRGFPADQLARHQYGFDDRIYVPPASRDRSSGLTMLFVGGCAPRKGLHYALEAWLRSAACRTGTFLIAGTFVPGYAEKLAALLAHPSVQLLGQRSDVPQLMQRSDLLVLSSIEEGSALVTSEARGSGCVLLVSEASGAICRHLQDGLVHRVGDVDTLVRHFDMLHADRGLLEQLRTESLRTRSQLTWSAAGVRLFDVYRDTLSASAETAASGDGLRRGERSLAA